MAHKTADKLVYCHEALHFRTKLQTAGYKQEVEKWDSEDSDSDESEEKQVGLLLGRARHELRRRARLGFPPSPPPFPLRCCSPPAPPAAPVPARDGRYRVSCDGRP